MSLVPQQTIMGETANIILRYYQAPKKYATRDEVERRYLSTVGNNGLGPRYGH